MPKSTVPERSRRNASGARNSSQLHLFNEMFLLKLNAKTKRAKNTIEREFLCCSYSYFYSTVALARSSFSSLSFACRSAAKAHTEIASKRSRLSHSTTLYYWFTWDYSRGWWCWWWYNRTACSLVSLLILYHKSSLSALLCFLSFDWRRL